MSYGIIVEKPEYKDIQEILYAKYKDTLLSSSRRGPMRLTIATSKKYNFYLYDGLYLFISQKYRFVEIAKLFVGEYGQIGIFYVYKHSGSDHLVQLLFVPHVQQKKLELEILMAKRILESDYFK